MDFRFWLCTIHFPNPSQLPLQSQISHFSPKLVFSVSPAACWHAGSQLECRRVLLLVRRCGWREEGGRKGDRKREGGGHVGSGSNLVQTRGSRERGSGS